jgi:hypothetical protein
MIKYLYDDTNKLNHQNPKIDYWYKQNNFALIRNKVTLFSEFAAVNIGKQNIRFIAEQQYVDDFQMNKDVSIILYQNGVPTNFEIPSRPGQPYANDTTSQSVTLIWSKPIYGRQSVQQYKIYSRINLNTPWTLLLITTDATPSAVISNLIQEIYQFKIQGITRAGDTAESDVSNVIG